jgi:hypothetical protein
MMDFEAPSPVPVTRATYLLSLFAGSLLAALTLFTTAASGQGVAHPATVKAEPHPKTIGDSRTAPHSRIFAGITRRRMGGTPLAAEKTAAAARLVESYGRLPLSFEPNQGQTDSQVKFLSRGPGYSLFLTGDEAVLALRKPSRAAASSIDQNLAFGKQLLAATTIVEERKTQTPDSQNLPPTVVRMKLLGANPRSSIVGLDKLPGKVHYFVGNDPKKWRTNVPSYVQVQYKEVYSGIDLVYHGNQRQIEYDFVLAPGADPNAIVLDVKSQQPELEAPQRQAETHARIDDRGNLVLPTQDGEVRFQKPFAYQLISDSRGGTSKNLVDSRYVLREGDRIGFELAEYDTGKTLVIDPFLNYSTYLGGSMDDFANAITVGPDTSGLNENVYVTGGTTSANFPTTSGVLQTTYAGADGGYQGVRGDVFVTKLNSNGSALVYSTYLGGSGDDNAYGIDVDPNGNVYLTGGTNSSDFPVTPGVYQPRSGGLNDVFVTKLDPTGSSILYSTHIGVPVEGIRGFGIAVDASGSAYVAGGAGPGFPTTTGAFQTTTNAFSCGFVLKLNPTGSDADYSTLLGGGDFNDIDYAESIALDENGDAYVTGYASSTTFPTTTGAFQAALGGGVDGFVTVLNPTGSALLYSTFLGGTANDEGYKIAVDRSGMAYVTGYTKSSNFPTTSGAFQTAFGGGQSDAFVAKFDPTKSGSASLVYSTFLGGSGDENLQDFLRDILAVDFNGSAYVTGTTTSTDFPTLNPLQVTSGGGFDAYVAKLNPAGSSLIYSTYLGGSGDDFGRGIAVDGNGIAYVAGQTSSPDFSVTPDSVQSTFGGSVDAFVASVAPLAVLSPAELTFASQPVGSSSSVQTAILTNERSIGVNITGISATGDFAQTNTCITATQTILGAGLNCTISVTFSPTFPADRTGTLTIITDTNSPSISLAGFGVGPAATLVGSSLNFGTQLSGTTSSPQVVSLTNTGNTPLTISSVMITGTNVTDFSQTNTCPGGSATLAVNASCTISVAFKATVTGNRAASIMITDDGPGSPQTVALTGTGTDFSLTVATGSNCPVGGNCSISATISAGQSATYNLQVTQSSGFNGSVALTCSGAPATSICTTSPSSVPPNGSPSYAFVVSVSNTSNVVLAPPLRLPRIPTLALTCTLIVLIFILITILIAPTRLGRKHPRRILAPALTALLIGLLYANGCGGGTNVPPPTNATLAITGVSGGVNRSVALNLTVNH